MLRLFTALFGPVFAKEMIELARRKRYYFNRVFYGAVLLLAVFVTWSDYQWLINSGQRSLIKGMAELAEHIFTTVSLIQYLAVYLFIPVFLCGTVASEREEGTLELLFTTQLKDREIVLGKLFSRLSVFILIAMCALPVLSIISFYGGIDPDALWRIQGSTLLAVLYAGAHSIYFSTVTKSPMGALIRTYWWMAFWILAVPLLVMLPVSLLARGPMVQWLLWVMGTLILINPGGNFVMSIIPEAYNQMNSLTVLGLPLYGATYLVPLAWSSFLIWLAVVRLRLLPTALGLATRRIPFVREIWLQVELIEQNWARWGRRYADRVWLVWPVNNPLWLRARIARVYDRERYIGRIQWLGWIVAFAFLILLICVEPRAMGRRGAAPAFLAPAWLWFTLLTSIFAGNSYVGDRRRGFFDLVTITPLRPSELIDGTFLAIWQHLRRSYWLPVFLSCFFVLTGGLELPLVFFSLITATLFTVVLILQGMACSLPARSVLDALLPTFVFPLFIMIGTPFSIVFFRQQHGFALWILSIVLLTGTWLWQRRGVSSIRVGAYFLAMHMAMTSAACAWTVSQNRVQNRGNEFPLVAQHPAVMTIMPLESQPVRDFGTANWRLLYVSYWLGLAVNIVWQRWWLIRNFDWLVGRVGRAALPEARKGHLKNIKVLEEASGSAVASGQPT